MIPDLIPRRPGLLALVLLGSFGCTGSGLDDSPPEPDLSNLVPVGGVITLNGEPLARAVVTFLPPHWASGVGETDAQGRYRLSYAGHPGVPPDHYKVAVSLLVSAEGEPQGLGPRSSIAKPPGMMSAREILPPGYADLGRTRLVAHVSPEGGRFDFDVKAPGLDSPQGPTDDPQLGPR